MNARGVEGVVAESAERLLADAYREHAACGGHPERQVRRQVEGEEKAGEDGRKVADGVLALHRNAAERLGDEAGRDAGAGEEKRAEAEEEDRASERREKRDDDVQHEAAHGAGAVRVRRA